MTYLFELDNFDEFSERYFLNDKMDQLYKEEKYDEILNERMNLIFSAEKVFVEKLEITYGE